MMKDGLRCLKQLSVYLLKNDFTIIFVMNYIENCKEKLLALKHEYVKTSKKFWDSYEDGCFKGVQVIKNESDVQKLVAFRGQFFHSLYDNLCQ
jgi:hypothetical protein